MTTNNIPSQEQEHRVADEGQHGEGVVERAVVPWVPATGMSTQIKSAVFDRSSVEGQEQPRRLVGVVEKPR
jgi:hypothetical protein